VARSSDRLTVAQFDLLSWVSQGCETGAYEGSSYRTSARALHNRGLIRIEGRGRVWTAKITVEGARLLEEQARRVEATRERERREEQARSERVREQQRLRARALEVLESVTQAGGRLDLDADISEREIKQVEAFLASEGLLPYGQRLAHEPVRMDPKLGVAAYLEPDLSVLTPLRAFKVPRQLRDPHSSVVAFQDKRRYVSKPQVPRAARYLQGLVNAAEEMGWKVSAKVPSTHAGRGAVTPDLSIRLPSSEFMVTVRELDHRGRPGNAFMTTTDYYTRTERTTANKSFLGSGRLEVTLSNGWEMRSILSLRDTAEATLEEQLPEVVRRLEIAEAEAQWARKEETRRGDIRKVRWEEVKKDAFAKLTYERNAERLRDELARRDAAASMCRYADEIIAHAADLDALREASAREWASWIRQHAERINPLNGPLQLIEVTSCDHAELEPHMDGWSTHGPRRN
jgi:hypothetical protein